MNPFGLVYQDAITENKENEVNIQKNNLHLRQHKSISKPIHTTTIQQRKQIPAITVAHPNGGCKEQVAGLFAQKLAQE